MKLINLPLLLLGALASLSLNASANHIMISGFDPFNGSDKNNSWEVALELKRLNQEALSKGTGKVKLSLCLLPTVYDQGALALQDCIQNAKEPVTQVISLGEEYCSLNFETVAHNKDSASTADNHGVVRSESSIISGANKTVGMSLPIHKYFCDLQREDVGVDIKISDHAGGFVCNNTAFNMLDYLDLPYMFIHVPNSKCKKGSIDVSKIAQGLYKVMERYSSEDAYSMPTSYKEANKIYKSLKKQSGQNCEASFFKKLRWKLIF